MTRRKNLDITTLRDPSPFWFGEGPLFRLEEAYTFKLDVPPCMTGCKPTVYTIPAGYEFDKASIPRLFWGTLAYMPSGLSDVPALEHDFLCDLWHGGSDWLRGELGGALPEVPAARLIHLHFRRRLAAVGVRPRKVWAMGHAVAAFGPGGWAWPFLKLALLATAFTALWLWQRH